MEWLPGVVFWIIFLLNFKITGTGIQSLVVRCNNIADFSLSIRNSFKGKEKKKRPTRNDLSWGVTLQRCDSNVSQYCAGCRQCLIMNNNTESGAEIDCAPTGIFFGAGEGEKKRSSDHFFKKTFLASRCFCSSLIFFFSLAIAVPQKGSCHYCEMIWANR